MSTVAQSLSLMGSRETGQPVRTQNGKKLPDILANVSKFGLVSDSLCHMWSCTVFIAVFHDFSHSLNPKTN